MGATRSKWRGNQLAFYDGTTYETVRPIAPTYFFDDFLNLYLQTAAAGVVGWTAKDTSGAGATFEVIVANQSGGVLKLELDEAKNEKEEAGIYWGDALNFNLSNGPIFEARVAIHTAPTDQAEIYLGLANAYVEGPIIEADAGPTKHAFFAFDAGISAGLVPACCTDDATIDTPVAGGATTTGITAFSLDAYHVLRIDCTNYADVKFYVDGVGVLASTTFAVNTNANVMLQPFLMAHKETGAGDGVIYIDYVRVWQATR
jgi:hypothetical protein